MRPGVRPDGAALSQTMPWQNTGWAALLAAAAQIIFVAGAASFEFTVVPISLGNFVIRLACIAFNGLAFRNGAFPARWRSSA